MYNGIDVDAYPFREDKDNYVLFLGRFSPDKGPHLAIDAARAAGRPILLAGKCSEPAERAYFLEEASPRLGPDVWLFGEAHMAAKCHLLSRARCLIFPVCWDERFGMVMIEALAAGRRWLVCSADRCPRSSSTASAVLSARRPPNCQPGSRR